MAKGGNDVPGATEAQRTVVSWDAIPAKMWNGGMKV